MMGKQDLGADPAAIDCHSCKYRNPVWVQILQAGCELTNLVPRQLVVLM